MAECSQFFSLQMRRKVCTKRYALAILEILVVFLAIMILIWLIFPSGNIFLLSLFIIALSGVTIWSHRWHGEDLKSLGFRTDNFLQSAKDLTPFTVIALVILIVSGALAKSIQFHPIAGLSIVFYPVWAGVQQYFFQSFFNIRLQSIIKNTYHVAIINALIYSTIHLPNWRLIVLTFITGFFWSLYFQKNTNLFTVSLSHGWLGTVLFFSWPSSWTHHLAIGPFYYQHQLIFQKLLNLY